MHNILLFIICILLIGDLIFLNRLVKLAKRGIDLSNNEKYFELKYNINLLKSISAILIFIIGYLGYSNYNEFKSKIESDFEENIKNQKKDISLVSSKIKEINTSLDSLKGLKNSLEVVVDKYQSKLININKKLASIDNSAKYNPRLYLVKNLKFPKAKLEVNQDGIIEINFNILKTSFNEDLPIFKNPPMINIQGHGIDIDILKTTKDKVKIGSASQTSYSEEDENKEYYLFDMWITSNDK